MMEFIVRICSIFKRDPEHIFYITSAAVWAKRFVDDFIFGKSHSSPISDPLFPMHQVQDVNIILC